MLIEAEKNFGVTAREKTKKALNFSKRNAVPTIQGVAVAVFIVSGVAAAIYQQKDNKVKNSIDAQVNEEKPRKVSEKEYKLAKREVSGFDKIKDRYVDPNTLTINVPQQIAEYNQLIEEEDARSQNVSQRKDQLMNEHKTKVGPRKIIALALIPLSLTIFMAPIFRKKISGEYKIKQFSPTPSIDS